MLESENASTFVAEYDRENDVLYIHLKGGNPDSYSIGNPAGVDGVEWIVDADDPQRITGATVLDWHRQWLNRYVMPPLPFAMNWDGTIANAEHASFPVRLP